MAKLPSQKKILKEIFSKKEQEWISLLLEPLNRFMEEVTNALNNALTFGENLDAEVKKITVDGNYPVTFKLARKNRPVAAWVGQCREVTENHVVLAAPISLDWEIRSDGMFQVNDVVGLTVSPENKYYVTIVLLNG